MTGTTTKDVIVGSPNRSDSLSGQGGGDTYVVGNQSRGITGPLSSGDTFSIEPVPPTGEADRVTLDSGATTLPDYIYLSTPLEQVGGLVGIAPLPQPNPPGGWGTFPYPGTITVAGSEALPTTSPLIAPNKYNALLDCISEKFIALAQPARSFELARRVSQGPWKSFFPLAMVARPLPFNLSEGLLRLSTWLNQYPPVRWTNQTKPSKEPAQTHIPGVPQIKGLVVTGDRADRLILPDKDYVNPLFKSDSENLISVVSGIKILQGERAVSSTEDARNHVLTRQANNQLDTSRYALFYFSDSGLLVFSYNQKPLGSEGNHGKIIAQLQSEEGRPLVLPTQTLVNDSVAQASFLSIQTTDTAPQDGRLSPPTPSTHCHASACTPYGR
jgi:hypothetical protein